MSNNRADLSSEAVTNAWPLGWYWGVRNQNENVHTPNKVYHSPNTINQTNTSTYTNAIHIRRVSKERLRWFLLADIPQFARFVHRTGHVGFHVGRQRERCHVTGVRIELGGLLARLQIPYAAVRQNVLLRYVLWSCGTIANKENHTSSCHPNRSECANRPGSDTSSGNPRSRPVHGRLSPYPMDRDCSHRRRCTCCPCRHTLNRKSILRYHKRRIHRVVNWVKSPTKLPDGANATLITQADRNRMTCTLFPVHVSQMISLPSNDPVTQCLRANVVFRLCYVPNLDRRSQRRMFVFTVNLLQSARNLLCWCGPLRLSSRRTAPSGCHPDRRISLGAYNPAVFSGLPIHAFFWILIWVTIYFHNWFLLTIELYSTWNFAIMPFTSAFSAAVSGSSLGGIIVSRFLEVCSLLWNAVT